MTEIPVGSNKGLFFFFFLKYIFLFLPFHPIIHHYPYPPSTPNKNFVPTLKTFEADCASCYIFYNRKRNFNRGPELHIIINREVCQLGVLQVSVFSPQSPY